MTDFPQEIRKPTMLANWRVKEAKKRVSSAQRREGNDAAHLAAIRQLPCCICGRQPPSDCHHLKGGPAAGKGERCMFRRSTDRWALPVCRVHHDLVQPVRGEDEDSLFKELGVPDVYALAKALYKAPKDVESKKRVLWAHRSGY